MIYSINTLYIYCVYYIIRCTNYSAYDIIMALHNVVQILYDIIATLHMQRNTENNIFIILYNYINAIQNYFHHKVFINYCRVYYRGINVGLFVNVYHTMYIVLRGTYIYTVQCTLYTIHCIMFSIDCILYTVHCTVYSVKCIYVYHAEQYNVQ